MKASSEYVRIAEPTEAFDRCLIFLRESQSGREIERDYYWSDSKGGLVEVLYETERNGFVFRNLLQCYVLKDGLVEIITGGVPLSE